MIKTLKTNLRFKKAAFLLSTVALSLSLSATAFAADTSTEPTKDPNNEVSKSNFHKPENQKLTPDEIKSDQNEKAKLVPADQLGRKGKSDDKLPPGLEGKNNGPQGFRMGDMWGAAKGTNSISFSSFDYGDIVLVHDGSVPWGYYRHAALFDSDYDTGSINDKSFWEANTDTNTVHRQYKYYYRNYDRATGMWVPNSTWTERYNTTSFAYAHQGEPYSVTLNKWDWTKWYCSKLVWAAYYNKTGGRISLLPDPTDNIIYPDDIYQDTDTKVFADSF